MTPFAWALAGLVVLGIALLATWAAVDAARHGRPIPGNTVFYVACLLGALVLILVLGAVVNILRLVYALVGLVGARLEHLLRRVAATGDTGDDEVVILDDHGHPYDPENTPWNEPWSTK